MRAMIALAALALTAAAPAPTPWTLRGDGLSRIVGGKPQVLRFGTPKKAALAAVTAVMGKPQMTRTSPDCGQGEPMTMVDYRGGLTIQFLKGKFSGWSLEGKVDPGLKTAAGITIGATRTALRKAYPDIDIDDGSLGVMFTREDGPSGFLDSMKPGARVIGLYAGETCMVS
ncbi:hypothetical protein P6144_09360 [Sphingomonas sp. HITSZ_GF]|uniref:hypothetical protein n=1 Tax=Sphingomonas sp. HITSZ_GF TaxID=3037247 RepID=UPI00240D5978|nr:hypothetical protein [Sphingomonas sp. HITSZ_GF]MDG2533851.1 hypothetical protein [Sphingomonas sp. HITSZ_GF]